MLRSGNEFQTTTHRAGRQPAEAVSAQPACPVLNLADMMERLNRVSASQNMGEITSELLDLMREVAEAKIVLFYLHDAENESYILAAARGDSQIQNLLGIRLNRNQGLVGEVMAAGGGPQHRAASSEPVIVGELFNDQNWLRLLYPATAIDTSSTLLLPLHEQDRLFGVVQLIDYTLMDMALLKSLGTRLVTEITRVTRLADDRHSNRRLKGLVSILAENGGVINRDQLLQQVTEQVTRLVNAERSTIFLVDPSNRGIGLNVAYESTGNEEEKHEVDPVSAIIFPVIRQRNRRGQNQGAGQSPATRAGGIGFTTRSAITVPLRSPAQSHLDKENRVTIGGLMALNKQGGAFDEEDVRLLEILADQTASLLHLTEITENASELYLDVIKSMVAALDAKDPYTQGHSLRVFEYAVALAQEMGLSDEMVANIRIASLLHDIGKIGISDTILGKKGTLTREEFEIMKKHATISGTIMKQVRMLEPVIPGIIEHHERMDGSGYPLGLRGDSISMMGRIIAIADVFDAMTSDRPYRPAMRAEAVLAYLKENAGKLFDQQAVEAFIRLDPKHSKS